jgi:hypothetical protein
MVSVGGNPQASGMTEQSQQSAEEVPGASQHSDAFPGKRRLKNFV